MIAKIIVQIFSGLKKYSLQVSLQKQQLNHWLQRTFCLQLSLQLQTVLKAACKENIPKYQSFTKIPFANSFAVILN
jgi:hypothetical protein